MIYNCSFYYPDQIKMNLYAMQYFVTQSCLFLSWSFLPTSSIDFQPLNFCSELQLQISTKNVVKNVTLFTTALYPVKSKYVSNISLLNPAIRFINPACYSLDIFLLTPSKDFQPLNVCSKLQYLLNLLFCWYDLYPVCKTKTLCFSMVSDAIMLGGGWKHGKKFL